MKGIIIGIMAAGIMAFPVHGEEPSGQKASTPQSMQEFVNWQLDRGACGTWSDVGVTEEMWVGIPAGLKVTNTQKTWFDVPTRQLFNSHHMATEDGRVISTGSNVMTWDPERKAVVSAGSGFDMGKPYHGNSVLLGMSEDTLTWEYTERSQGKTTVYENIVTYTGPNTRTNSVKVKGSDGKPWVSESSRENPIRTMLDGSGLVGTWDQAGPDGSIWREKVSWAVDGHVLKYEGMSGNSDGEWKSDSLFIWYWDPVHDHIAALFFDYHGAVIHGKVDSIRKEGDSVTIVSSYEGSRFGGITMSTQMTQVIDANTISTSFQGMALDGMRYKLNWSEGTQTTKRVD